MHYLNLPIYKSHFKTIKGPKKRDILVSFGLTVLMFRRDWSSMRTWASATGPSTLPPARRWPIGCPRSLVHYHQVCCFVKMDKTSWTYSIRFLNSLSHLISIQFFMKYIYSIEVVFLIRKKRIRLNKEILDKLVWYAYSWLYLMREAARKSSSTDGKRGGGLKAGPFN